MRKVITSLVIFVFVFLTFFATKVSAKILSNQNGNVTVAKTEVINDDLFVGAQAVEIDGTINGDVFIGAQTVKITGIVNGNLHVGASILDLTGSVKGNIYAGAQSITINDSKIGGSLLLGATTINIDKNTNIGGSVLAGAGMLNVDSQIKRSVYAGTGSLTVGDNAIIGKDLYFASGSNQANISTKAKIVGSTYKTEVKNSQNNAGLATAKKQIPVIINAVRFGTTIISFIGALIVGLIYLKLFDKHFSQTAKIISLSFWKSLGIGFLITIAAVPGLIILFVTVVGIPLAGLAVLMLLLYSYLTKVVVGSALGNWVTQKFNWKMSTYWAFAFGLFLIYVLKLIPVVGFLVGLIVFFCGLGALALQMFSKSN